MKKLLLAITLALATSLSVPQLAWSASAALTTDQIYKINHKDSLNLSLSLGTVLADAQAVSGDVTCASGVCTVGAAKVTEAMLKSQAGAVAGLYASRVAHAIWDPSGDSTMRSVAAHGLGVSLPARAIIKQSWFHTKTSVVSTNNDGTIAFSCTAANDILSAADIDASSGVAGQVTTGVSTGSAANMKLNGSSACEITATVAVDAFTAGKIDIFVEYVVSE